MYAILNYYMGIVSARKWKKFYFYNFRHLFQQYSFKHSVFNFFYSAIRPYIIEMVNLLI